MVRDRIFDTEATEPAIRKIDLNLFTQPSLRADREHIANDQHSDHQLRVDRGTAGMGVVAFELPVHPVQVEHGIDLTNRMVYWDHGVEFKSIEELPLTPLTTTHHRNSPRLQRDRRESRLGERINESFTTVSLQQPTFPVLSPTSGFDSEQVDLSRDVNVRVQGWRTWISLRRTTNSSRRRTRNRKYPTGRNPLKMDAPL